MVDVLIGYFIITLALLGPLCVCVGVLDGLSAVISSAEDLGSALAVAFLGIVYVYVWKKSNSVAMKSIGTQTDECMLPPVVGEAPTAPVSSSIQLQVPLSPPEPKAHAPVSEQAFTVCPWPPPPPEPKARAPPLEQEFAVCPRPPPPPEPKALAAPPEHKFAVCRLRATAPEPTIIAAQPEQQLAVCPRCGSRMMLRAARRGGWFRGCMRFPECRGTLPPQRAG